MLKAPELSQLLAVEEKSDLAAARALVDADKAAAVVIIPAGFTASMIPQIGAGYTSRNADRGV